MEILQVFILVSRAMEMNQINKPSDLLELIFCENIIYSAILDSFNVSTYNIHIHVSFSTPNFLPQKLIFLTLKTPICLHSIQWPLLPKWIISSYCLESYIIRLKVTLRWHRVTELVEAKLPKYPMTFHANSKYLVFLLS